MSNLSELLKKKIKNKNEVKRLLYTSKAQIIKAAQMAIFPDHPTTYEKVGKAVGISQHSVYEMLKRLYFKVYGEKYIGRYPRKED